MATTTIIASGFTAAYTLQIYRNTRLYKKFTIKTAAGVAVDIRGWTILFTMKPPGSITTDDSDALITVNTVIPAIDTNGALGIFYLDIPDSDADVEYGKYDCDFIYIVGGERYPLMKFKSKVTENITKRESI